MSDFSYVQGSDGTATAGAISVAFTSNVTQGNLLSFALSYLNNSGTGVTFSVADSFGTVYSVSTEASGGGTVELESVGYAIAAATGPCTITATLGGASPTGRLALIIDEFAVPFGYAPVAGTVAKNQLFGTAGTTGNMTFSASGPWMIYAGFCTEPSSTLWTHGTGFTATGSVASGFVASMAEYQLGLTSSNSPLAATATNVAASYCAIGIPFNLVQQPFVPSLLEIPWNHAAGIPVSLTATSSIWTASVTTFTATGSGVSVPSQSCSSPTAAVVNLSTTGSTGSCVIQDSLGNQRTIQVVPTTLNVNLPQLGVGQSATIALTGTGTLWTLETASTLFSASGVAGVTVSSIVVTGNGSATATLTAGVATGTCTITDTSTQATDTVNIVSPDPAFTASPGTVLGNQASVTVTLSGVNTLWNGSTVFALSGSAASGCSITGSPTINSSTSASFVLNTGGITGALTISDGLYSTTVTLEPLAMVSHAFLGRSGLAQFFVGNTTSTYSPNGTTTYAVTGTTQVSGGANYTDPVAYIAGGITLAVVFGGSAFTSAPDVELIGGTGQGFAATAIISNGALIGFTITNPGTNYKSTDPLRVCITGGGGLYAEANAFVTVNGGFGAIPGKPLVVNGVVTVVPMSYGGLAYTSAPPITIVDPTGSGASFTAVLGGTYTGVLAPLAHPVISVNGTPVATPVYASQFPVSNCGSGFTSAPAFSLSGGSSTYNTLVAKVNITTTGGLALTLGSPGTNYTSAPAVVFTGGTGSGASAQAFINAAGQVVGVSVTPGVYTVAPTAAFVGGGGSGATASVSLGAGHVASITVTAPGTGFFPGDVVTAVFTGGAGSNAAAAVLLQPMWFDIISEVPDRYIAYQLQCGSVAEIVVQYGGSGHDAGNIAVSASGGGGTGLVLGTPVVVDGTISAVAITAGTATAGNQVRAVDPALLGSGFAAFYGITGSTINSTLSIDKGGSGYFTAGNPTFASASFNDGPQGLAFGTSPTKKDGVLIRIPIVDGGRDYTSAPTITITGSTTSDNAIAVAIMSGPVATDVVTYTVADGWLSCQFATYSLANITTNSTSSGTIAGATNAPMMNYAGVVEPWMNGGASFPKTCELGLNFTYPYNSTSGKSLTRNWLKWANTFTGAVNPITASTLQTFGTVAFNNGSTTGTLSTTVPTSFASVNGQYVWIPGDSTGSIYTVSSVSGTTLTLTSAFQGTNITGATWVTSPKANICIVNGAGDSTGGLAQAVAEVSAAGAIVDFVITCHGGNYTVTPTVVMPAPASGGTLATATATLTSGGVSAITPGTPGSGYAGSTPDSHPISCTGTTGPSGVGMGGFPTAYVIVQDALQTNAINSQNLPDQAGPWSLTWDDAAPNAQMTVQLFSGTLNAFIAPSGTPGPGTLINGVQVGKTLTWNVTRGTSTTWNLDVQLVVSGPTISNQCPYTLLNENMTAPLGSGSNTSAVTPDRANPLAPEPNSVALYSQGTSSMAVARIWLYRTFWWDSDATDASDLRSGNDFSWIDNAQRAKQVTVVAIRRYTATTATGLGYSSPYVFTNNNYPGTQSTSGMSSPPAPYYWVPANDAWLSYGTNSDMFYCEFVTALPHGLKTGQQFTCPSNSVTTALPVFDANFNFPIGRTVSGTIGGQTMTVFVTGTNTFACGPSFSGAVTQIGSHSAYVTGVNACFFNISFQSPWGSGAPSYEAAAKFAASIPGCALHVHVPAYITDAGMAAIAGKCRDIMPVGTRTYFELSNEHWNSHGPGSGGRYQDWFSLSALYSTASEPAPVTAYHADQAFARRQSQLHDVAAATYNQPDAGGNVDRGGEIIRIFGFQLANSAVSGNIVGYANTYNGTSPAPTNPIRIDAGMTSIYPGIEPSITLTAAAASTYSDYPSSNMYRTTAPITMGQWVDLLRSRIAYGATQGCISPNVKALASYNLSLVPGQGAPPVMISYEEGLNDLIPTPVSASNWYLRACMAHDAFYHPYMYDVTQAIYQAAQAAGATLLNGFFSTGNLFQGSYVTTINGNVDWNGVVGWPTNVWPGQTWGLGDGTPDGNGNDTVNIYYHDTVLPQHLLNVSPRAQGMRDWMLTGGNTIVTCTPIPPPPVLAVVDCFSSPRRGKVIR